MEKPVADNSSAVPQQASAQPVPQPVAQPAAPKASAAPISNPAMPDKTVPVPKFVVCMAGDATPIKDVIHAVRPKE